MFKNILFKCYVFVDWAKSLWSVFVLSTPVENKIKSVGNCATISYSKRISALFLCFVQYALKVINIFSIKN